jgi:L-rhamnose-H+ transport protein
MRDLLIMGHPKLGFLILLVAGVMNAAFTLPMKYTRRWAWENTWLAWTVFALLLQPPIIALLTVPKLICVYEAAELSALWKVIVFGIGWGIAQVFFGIAVESIGISLTFSVVMGTSAAVGATVPLVHLRPEKLLSGSGHALMFGIVLVLAGVVLCAFAGRSREKALQLTRTGSGNMTKGLLLALLCGFGASFVNLGVTFGAPLIRSAQDFGASSLSATNSVWLPFMWAGAIPNLGYCFYLLNKNVTYKQFLNGGANHWLSALVMALFWFASTLLYGFSASLLGTWGPILAWPLFMSLIVITASLLGVLTGEWRNSGWRPLAIQWMGVSVLVLAVVVLAAISRSFV